MYNYKITKRFKDGQIKDTELNLKTADEIYDILWKNAYDYDRGDTDFIIISYEAIKKE